MTVVPPATPVKPAGSHPVARLLLCMLAGLLAWIAVGYWLDPKPIWSLDFTKSHTVLTPFHVDATGQYLVAGEWKAIDRNAHPTVMPTTLKILDMKTGETLHTVASTMPRINYGGWRNNGSELPRWRGGEVWRVASRYADDSSRVTELRAWAPGEASERMVHVWTSKYPFGLSYAWPVNSSMFVTKTDAEWMAAFLLLPQPCESLLLHACQLDKDIVSWRPSSLLQTWKLPASTSDHSSQIMESFKINLEWETRQNWTISPDGGKIAIAFGNELPDTVALKKARTMPGLGNADLFHCYIPGPRKLQIYDTHTGALELDKPAPEFINYMWLVWVDGSLVIGCRDFSDNTNLLLMDTSGRMQHKDWFDQQSTFYDVFIKPDGTSLELPARLEKKRFVYHLNEGGRAYINPRGSKQSIIKEHFPWMRLKPEGNRLLIECECDLSSFHGNPEALLQQPNAPLLMLREAVTNQAPVWLEALSKKSQWIKNFVEDYFTDQVADTIIVSLIDGKEVYRWKNTYAMIDGPVPSKQHLFLLSFRDYSVELMHSGVHGLQCFALPLHINSPWWSRGAGMAVTIVLWFLITLLRSRLARRRRLAAIS